MGKKVHVFVCEKNRTARRGRAGALRGGEADNSTIHLAVVFLVVLHPTGA